MITIRGPAKAPAASTCPSNSQHLTKQFGSGKQQIATRSLSSSNTFILNVCPFSIFIPDVNILSEAVRKPLLRKLSSQTRKVLCGSTASAPQLPVRLLSFAPVQNSHRPPCWFARVTVGRGRDKEGAGTRAREEGGTGGRRGEGRVRAPAGRRGRAEAEAEAGSVHAHAAPAVLGLNRADQGRCVQPWSLLLSGGERGSGALLLSGQGAVRGAPPREAAGPAGAAAAGLGWAARPLSPRGRAVPSHLVSYPCRLSLRGRGAFVPAPRWDQRPSEEARLSPPSEAFREA